MTLVVREYDEAITFFTQALGFQLIQDADLGGGKRWVRVGPGNSNGASVLLARAATPAQSSRIGNQTGGRVFLFLQTDDCRRDCGLMKARGVRFIDDPRDEEYGTVAVFEDLYGNRWDLLQPRSNGSVRG